MSLVPNWTKKALRSVINAAPRSVTAAVVQRIPRLVPYLDERDVVINLSNQYFGNARMSLSRRFRVEAELLYRHAYDQKTLLYLMRIVHRGDSCIDVGANIGAITLSLAHRVGSGGRVLAYEPGPLLFQRLVRNVALSGFRNIECKDAGLSDAPGRMYWRLETGINRGNAVLTTEPTETMIPVVTLDSSVGESALTRVDFIKIDVEGMELRVILGGLGTIRKFKPTLLIETFVGTGIGSDDDIQAVMSRLATEGYDFWEIDVPEAHLTSYSPDFHFIRCTYPRLPQNTLCVHKSREAVLTGT